MERRLGVTQTTVWKIKHKLKQVMLERDATKRLTGRVEIDDAYLGGERRWKARSMGAWENAVVVAVETTAEGKPVRLKESVTSFCARAMQGSPSAASTDCSVVSDGLQDGSVADAGCAHQVVKTGSGPRAAARRRSNGPTPRSATSRPLLQEPTVPSIASMSRATSPNSNTASTDDTISRHDSRSHGPPSEPYVW